MKKNILIVFIALISFACIEDNPTLTTFTGEMIYSHLKSRPELYSEYVSIIDKAGFKGMLSAYGTYTCIAPTNEAFEKYYQSFGPNFNIDSLSQEELDYLARTHIVDNEYYTDELSEGVLPNPNMNKRYVNIKFRADSITNEYIIYLNDSSRIISRDNKVYNGVVQGVNRVLQPSNAQLPEFIKLNEELSIFTEALELTGLFDSLLLVKDDSYFPTKTFKDEYDGFDIVNPEERKYGYTAFVEPNSLYEQYGIYNIDDLIAKAKELYPGSSEYDNDFTNRENSLNKFISYHLVNKAIQINKFFYTSNAIKDYIPDEFIETFYSNRIIKASKLYKRITLNPDSDFKTRVLEDGTKTTINGVYHLLDDLLVYDSSVESMLLNSRIRFDIVSLFPELTNNNIRGSRGFMKVNNGTGDRFGFEMGYIKDIEITQDTRLIYLAAKDNLWANFQGDELMGLGAYDITMRLLPVPPGTYELRFGYSANGLRSITQIYVDGKPIGIPLDLRIGASNPKIGWLLDSETEDNGYENDKMMRNRGYMKGPTTYVSGETPVREKEGNLRRIIATFTFNDYSAHTLRFKSVTDNTKSQCMMDYFEYVPKSLFAPATGEPESRE